MSKHTSRKTHDDVDRLNLVPRPPWLKDAEILAARVEGRALGPRFEEGDVLILAKTTNIENGTRVGVKIHDTIFLKRYWLTCSGQVTLESLHATPPLTIDPSEIEAIYNIEQILPKHSRGLVG